MCVLCMYVSVGVCVWVQGVCVCRYVCVCDIVLTHFQVIASCYPLHSMFTCQEDKASLFLPPFEVLKSE